MTGIAHDAPSTGATLIELIVVLVVMGVIAGVSALAITSLRPPAGSVDHGAGRAARRRAILLGTPQSVQIRGVIVRFLPDGSALGAGADPFGGEGPW